MDEPQDCYRTLAQGRHSVRAFLPRTVPEEWIARMLEQARLAPSGANLQPGHFWQITGKARAALTTALSHAWEAGEPAREDYAYFPAPMPMHLRKRQVAAAQALYASLGVARGDAAGRQQQFARNFTFFEAPVALVVTLERGFGGGGFMDLGLCLHALMLAAQARGLASCAIGALASYPDVVREVLRLPRSELVVCGMALGWPDPQAPVNGARTPRLPWPTISRYLSDERWLIGGGSTCRMSPLPEQVRHLGHPLFLQRGEQPHLAPAGL